MGLKLYEEWVKLYEDKVPVSIDRSEIGRVDKNDTQTITQIEKLVDSADIREEVISLLITQKNFDEKSAKHIFKLSVEHKSHTNLLELLKNPSKQVDFDKLPQNGNIIQLVTKQTGCSYEFCESLADFVPNKSVIIGRYEMFLRLMLKGGKTPSKKGDVEVNGKELEVKSTKTKDSGFRLRGQSGYGTGKQVQLAFLNAIKEYYGKGGPNHVGTHGIPSDIFAAYKSQRGQLWYKDPKNVSWGELATRDIVSMSLANKDEMALVWAKALNELYPESSPERIQKAILPAFKNDGSIDMTEIINILAAYEYMIYREVEQFDYFMVLNYRNDYILFQPTLSFENILKIIKSNFRTTAPNTKDNSTSQDAVTQIVLK